MSDTLDSMVAEAIENQPEVSPVAENAMKAEQPQTMDSFKVEPQTIHLPPANSPVGTQATPEIFNPEIHQTDASGNPVYTQAGGFAKKRGRKPGQRNRPDSSYNPGAGVIDTDNEKIQKAHACAVTVVGIMFMVGRAIGGEEFTPIVDANTGHNEPKMLTDAWTQYFMTSEVESIPPWLGVAVASLAFILPRTVMPQTAGKLTRLWDWICSKFSKSEKPAD